MSDQADVNRPGPPADPRFPDGVSAVTQRPVLGADPEPSPNGEPPAQEPKAPVATPDKPEVAQTPEIVDADPMQAAFEQFFVTPPEEPEAPGGKPGEDVRTLLKRLGDRQETIDRQGAELGDLRRRVRELDERLAAQPAPGVAVPEPGSVQVQVPELDLDQASDPEYLTKYLADRDAARDAAIRQEAIDAVMQQVKPVLQPLIQVQAATRVAETNPLAKAALSHPQLLGKIQEISQNKDLLATRYSGQGNSLDDMRLKSAIFDIIGETWSTQVSARSEMREELRATRPEHAGAETLPGDGRGGPGPPSDQRETDEERVSKMGPVEGAKFFSKRFRDRQFGRPVA